MEIDYTYVKEYDCRCYVFKVGSKLATEYTIIIPNWLTHGRLSIIALSEEGFKEKINLFTEGTGEMVIVEQQETPSESAVTFSDENGLIVGKVSVKTEADEHKLMLRIIAIKDGVVINNPALKKLTEKGCAISLKKLDEMQGKGMAIAMPI